MAQTGVVLLKTRLTAQSYAAIAARFNLSNRKLVVSLQRRNKEFHQAVRETTAVLAPWRTGYMSEHVETRPHKDWLAAETGWWWDTFMTDAAVTRGKFYPPWQEYGQEHHSGTPSLGPANQMHSGAFLAGVKSDLRTYGRRV